MEFVLGRCDEGLIRGEWMKEERWMSQWSVRMYVCMQSSFPEIVKKLRLSNSVMKFLSLNCCLWKWRRVSCSRKSRLTLGKWIIPLHVLIIVKCSIFLLPYISIYVIYIGRVCVCMCVLVAQTCPTLCDPTDCSPPSSSVHGILQAKYWSGLPFLSPEDLPDPGIKPGFPVLQADALPSELLGILLANSRVITA